MQLAIMELGYPKMRGVQKTTGFKSEADFDPLYISAQILVLIFSPYFCLFRRFRLCSSIRYDDSEVLKRFSKSHQIRPTPHIRPLLLVPHGDHVTKHQRIN
jgi:hypothetical protein